MKAISIKLPDLLFHDLAQHAKTSASSHSDFSIYRKNGRQVIAVLRP